MSYYYERKKRKTAIILTAMITFIVTMLLVVGVYSLWGPSTRVWLAQRYLLTRSLDTTVTEKELEDTAIKAMLGCIDDPYSRYLDEEDFEETMTSFTTGEYVGVGIGVAIDYASGSVLVTSVTPESPADKAGMHPGWNLYMIDNEVVTVDNCNALFDKVKEKAEGDEVEITLEDPETGERREFDVILEVIKPHDVRSDIIDGKYGYINIIEFEVGTAELFKETLDKLMENDLEALFIDLRSNPGGLVDEAVPIIDNLMGEGEMATFRDRNDKVVIKYVSDADKIDLPIVVFVNEHSASASELVAGALADTGNATVIGKTTYGKAVGQTIFPIDAVTGLYFSHIKVHLPSGVSINGMGVVPHYEVELAEGVNPVAISHDEDPYVKKAIEIIESAKTDTKE